MNIKYGTRVKVNGNAWENRTVQTVTPELKQAIDNLIKAMPVQRDSIKYHTINIKI